MYARLAIVAVLGASVAGPATASPSWLGTYVYAEPLGRDGAGQGNVISVTHTLTVTPGRCRIVDEGFQTYDGLVCHTINQGDRLQVLFTKYDDSADYTHHQFNRYRPNQPLFTLTRVGMRGLLTTWAGYHLETKGKPGVFFKKE